MKNKLKSKKYAFSISRIKEPTEKINLLDILKKQSEGYKKIDYNDLINNDIKLNKYSNNLNNIKNESIKEFIYSNRTIPIIWKKLKNYQNIVMNLFSRDEKFLSYVGHIGENQTKNNRPKTSILYRNNNNKLSKNYNSSYSLLNNSHKFEKKNFSILNKKNMKNRRTTPSYSLNSLNNFKKGLLKQISEKEMENILNDYTIKYPIKEKINELFPQDILNSIDKRNIDLNLSNQICECPNEMKQKTLNKYINYKNKDDDLIKNRLLGINKKLNYLNHNIYSNLSSFSSSSSKIKKRNASAKINKNKTYGIFLNDNSESFNKKHKINNKLIKKFLEGINYYGPYYSHCPPCWNKNIDFYNRLGENKSIKLIKFIKQIKEKTKIKNRNNKLN